VTIHTSNALVPVAAAELPAILAPDLKRAADLAREEKAAATRKAYGSDFTIFRAPLVRRPRRERATGRP
jgi:hypothetical protein